MTAIPGRADPAQAPAGFRQDINALRAWAVLAVVGYHFNIAGFASGFVGVDIFFVISGYLITTQVLSQLKNGSFSFLSFWVSRLRRIVPALLVVTVSSLVLGWCLTMPGEFLRHAREALAALAFVSNVAFGGERGYFDAAANTKPLLHTWSLSIEWQFYLLLPFILATFWRVSPAIKKQPHVLAGLVVCTLASMAWCFWISRVDAGAAFFSLWARAWELLLGGVMASAYQMLARYKTAAWFPAALLRRRGAMSVTGWLLVGLSALSGLPSGHWPGLLTLLPVAGTALIVWGGPVAVLSCLTHTRALQRIGDWSYSIYLWHWPVWVFMQQWASYRGMPVEMHHKFGLLLLSLVLGYLSYRYVEQPVRWRRSLWTPARLWGGYGLALLGLTAFTLATVKTHGFPQRVPEYQQRAELARRTNTPRDECFRDSKSEKQVAAPFCEFGAPPAPHRPSAMLWGDSHANQYLEPISRAASKLGVHGLIATQSNCRAFLEASSGDRDPTRICQAFNQEVLKFLRQAAQPGIVILGRNWWPGESGALQTAGLIRDLLLSGQTVILILPSLQVGFDVPERWIRDQFRAGQAIEELRLAATPELMQQGIRQEIAQATQEFANNPKFLTVDPLPKICADGYCYLVRGGQANFRDTAHISNVNASQYEDIFATVLSDAVSASLGISPGKRP
jgi:peptidoglycan/LPS O-acetylase OafA/YrhL